jgi:hypothetical protein
MYLTAFAVSRICSDGEAPRRGAMRQVPNPYGGLNMKKIRLVLLSAVMVSTIVAAVFTIGLLRPAAAPPAPAPAFVFTAKWICNIPLASNPNQTLVDPAAAENIGLVPGEYKTDINVHNPSNSENLTILKEFVVSVPEPNPGAIFTNRVAFASTFLMPGGAFFIDCKDIFSVFSNAGVIICPPPTRFPTCAVKGFVTLSQGPIDEGFISPNSLDVVAEYSSESLAFTSSSTTTFTFCHVSGVSFPFLPCSSVGISLDVEKVPSTLFIP